MATGRPLRHQSKTAAAAAAAAAAAIVRGRDAPETERTNQQAGHVDPVMMTRRRGRQTETSARTPWYRSDGHSCDTRSVRPSVCLSVCNVGGL